MAYLRSTDCAWQKTGEAVTATRRRLKRDLELPVGRGYDELIHRLLKQCR